MHFGFGAWFQLCDCGDVIDGSPGPGGDGLGGSALRRRFGANRLEQCCSADENNQGCSGKKERAPTSAYHRSTYLDANTDAGLAPKRFMILRLHGEEKAGTDSSRAAGSAESSATDYGG